MRFKEGRNYTSYKSHDQFSENQKAFKFEEYRQQKAEEERSRNLSPSKKIHTLMDDSKVIHSE